MVGAREAVRLLLATGERCYAATTAKKLKLLDHKARIAFKKKLEKFCIN